MQSAQSVTQFQKLQKIQLANAVDNFAILASHHKITFTEVAQGIGREPGVLFRFANGNHGRSDLRMIYEIANYFGYDIDTFITTAPDEILKSPVKKSKSLVVELPLLNRTTYHPVPGLAINSDIRKMSICFLNLLN